MENVYLEDKEIIVMGDFNIDLLRPNEVSQRWKDIEEGFLSLKLYMNALESLAKGNLY